MGSSKTKNTNDYEFGSFQLNRRECLLLRDGEAVHLPPKSFELLLHLLDHAGQLVDKQELMDVVWGDSLVTENSLTQCVRQVRSALESDGDSPVSIETVPTRGFRLLGEVRILNPVGTTSGENPKSNPPINQQFNQRVKFALPAIAVVIGLLVIALGYFVNQSRIGEAVTDKSVAVLPFVDLSPERSEQWYSDGVTEEIINSLVRLPELRVSARTSSFQFRGANLGIPEIAVILGVAYIIEGSVRRDDDQLRITAQLVRAGDGFQVWSETYDGSTESVFDVQEDVAEKIASALDVFLDDERREMMFQNGTRNVEAFEAYLKGMDIFSKVHARATSQTLWDANKFFADAMELDPSFATAFIMHSDAFAHVVIQGVTHAFVRVNGEARYSPEQAMDLLLTDLDYAVANARNSATQLVAELNREFFSPTWHRMPGLIARLPEQVNGLYSLDRIWSGTYLDEILGINGQREVRRLLLEARLINDPLDLITRSKMASIENWSGNFDVGRELISRGRSITGDNILLRGSALIAAIYASDREEVIDFLGGNVGDFAWYRPYLAAVQGEYEEATRLAVELEASLDWPMRNLLLVYYETGDEAHSRALTKKIDALPSGSVLFANLMMGMGDPHVVMADAPNFATRLQQAGIDPESIRKLPRLSTIGESSR